MNIYIPMTKGENQSAGGRAQRRPWEESKIARTTITLPVSTLVESGKFSFNPYFQASLQLPDFLSLT